MWIKNITRISAWTQNVSSCTTVGIYDWPILNTSLTFWIYQRLCTRMDRNILWMGIIYGCRIFSACLNSFWYFSMFLMYFIYILTLRHICILVLDKCSNILFSCYPTNRPGLIYDSHICAFRSIIIWKMSGLYITSFSFFLFLLMVMVGLFDIIFFCFYVFCVPSKSIISNRLIDIWISIW